MSYSDSYKRPLRYIGLICAILFAVCAYTSAKALAAGREFQSSDVLADIITSSIMTAFVLLSCGAISATALSVFSSARVQRGLCQLKKA